LPDEDRPDLPPMPREPHDDETHYDIPLHDLTGRHGYALARGEGDDHEPDPGAPIAYVAEQVKDRPSALTIEGMIVGIGNAAQGAAREGGSSAWVMRVLAAFFILPFVIVLLRNVGIL
jgi:hypothetical protein